MDIITIVWPEKTIINNELANKIQSLTYNSEPFDYSKNFMEFQHIGDLEQIRLLLDKNQVDLIVKNAVCQNIKLLICDMESTIIENEFLDEIADELNIKDKVAFITERAMNGELDFAVALKERINLIVGFSEQQMINLIDKKLKYNPGAKELIASCKKAGIYTMLVSGGFTIFTDHVAKELGFDEAHANQLEFEEGRLMRIKEPILGKKSKLELLKLKTKQLGISMHETAAIGDGANDLPMLKAAGLGIAYKAKPKVRAEIKNQINYTDLTTAAHAFGIEIVEF